MNWSDYFTYNPETGELRWKERSDINDPVRLKQWNTKYAGCVVGSLGSGGRYLEAALTINGKRHNLKVHRICYEMHYGPIPEGMEVDHVNHITTDNRALNFELKTHKGNMRNMSRQHNNTSGFSGIHKNKHGKWVVRIGGGKRGSRIYIGCFSSLDDAVSARNAAEIEHGYHENHGK